MNDGQTFVLVLQPMLQMEQVFYPLGEESCPHVGMPVGIPQGSFQQMLMGKGNKVLLDF